MIRITLGDKTYSVDFVSGRALREIDSAATMAARISSAAQKAMKGETVEDPTPVSEAMDVLAHWFCLLFRNQFTVDELFDGYPCDRLVHDITFALLAVQSQTTEILDEFPTKAVQPMEQPTKD